MNYLAVCYVSYTHLLAHESLYMILVDLLFMNKGVVGGAGGGCWVCGVGGVVGVGVGVSLIVFSA
ncbi:hypothetical protein ACQ4LK_24515, partial [Bacillus pumilus]